MSSELVQEKQRNLAEIIGDDVKCCCVVVVVIVVEAIGDGNVDARILETEDENERIAR